MTDRAVAAERALGRAAWGPRARRAGLLLRLGRDEDKAMIDLAELRQRLTCDPEAVTCVGEALEFAGRTETAVDWLTGALDDLSSHYPTGVSERLPDLVRHLACERRRLRKALELPIDHYDDFV